jgi:hypothetical protein
LPGTRIKITQDTVPSGAKGSVNTPASSRD